MADVPDQLVLEVAGDWEGKRDVAFRRIALGAIVVVLGLGLFNVFGQRPATTVAAADAATLEELAAQARLNAQIAHIEDVEWAVLETGGQISFIPKRS